MTMRDDFAPSPRSNRGLFARLPPGWRGVAIFLSTVLFLVGLWWFDPASFEKLSKPGELLNTLATILTVVTLSVAVWAFLVEREAILDGFVKAIVKAFVTLLSMPITTWINAIGEVLRSEGVPDKAVEAVLTRLRRIKFDWARWEWKQTSSDRDRQPDEPSHGPAHSDERPSSPPTSAPDGDDFRAQTSAPVSNYEPAPPPTGPIAEPFRPARVFGDQGTQGTAWDAQQKTESRTVYRREQVPPKDDPPRKTETTGTRTRKGPRFAPMSIVTRVILISAIAFLKQSVGQPPPTPPSPPRPPPHEATIDKNLSSTLKECLGSTSPELEKRVAAANGIACDDSREVLHCMVGKGRKVALPEGLLCRPPR